MKKDEKNYEGEGQFYEVRLRLFLLIAIVICFELRIHQKQYLHLFKVEIKYAITLPFLWVNCGITLRLLMLTY